VQNTIQENCLFKVKTAMRGTPVCLVFHHDLKICSQKQQAFRWYKDPCFLGLLGVSILIPAEFFQI
jgi:hypothetical protein